MGGIKREACDAWFSDCIRHAAGYRCEHCGKPFPGLVQGFECAHIYGRRNKSTRWCVGNAVALCSHCHREFTEHPLDFQHWLQTHLGQGHMDILREKKNQTFKATASIKREISKHYREEFRRMESENTTDLVSYQ